MMTRRHKMLRRSGSSQRKLSPPFRLARVPSRLLFFELGLITPCPMRLCGRFRGHADRRLLGSIRRALLQTTLKMTVLDFLHWALVLINFKIFRPGKLRTLTAIECAFLPLSFHRSGMARGESGSPSWDVDCAANTFIRPFRPTGCGWSVFGIIATGSLEAPFNSTGFAGHCFHGRGFSGFDFAHV